MHKYNFIVYFIVNTHSQFEQMITNDDTYGVATDIFILGDFKSVGKNNINGKWNCDRVVHLFYLSLIQCWCLLWWTASRRCCFGGDIFFYVIFNLLFQFAWKKTYDWGNYAKTLQMTLFPVNDILSSARFPNDMRNVPKTNCHLVSSYRRIS